MKKLVSVLIVLTLLLVSATAFADDVMRIAWWGSEVSNAYQLEFCDMFTDATGIEYEAEYLGWSDYWTKMNTLAAASDLPDVIRQDYSRIAAYVEKGLLMDLSGLVESGQIDLSNVPDTALSNGYFNGKLYGINIGSNAFGFIVNKALIEEAGMEPLPIDATWDEFIQYCLDYHEATGKMAVSIFQMSGSNVLRILARGQGGDLYNEDQTAYGFDKQLLVDYFASLKKLIDAGATDPASTLTVNISNEDTSFAKAESAMAFDWTDTYTTYDNLLKGTYGGLGLTVVPGAAENGGMYIKPSQLFSIPATCENVDAAATFINYWVNDEAANRFLAGRRGVPISTVSAQLVAEQLDDTSQRVFDYINNTIQPYCSDIYAPDPTAHSEIESELEKQFQLVMFGETDPETAADQVFETAEKLLNE